MNRQYQKQVAEGNELNKPVYNIKVGPIKIAIWANDSKYGRRHSVTIEQVYKDEDGKWASSTSITASHLPLAEKALAKAFDWIYAEESQGVTK